MFGRRLLCCLSPNFQQGFVSCWNVAGGFDTHVVDNRGTKGKRSESGCDANSVQVPWRLTGSWQRLTNCLYHPWWNITSPLIPKVHHVLLATWVVQFKWGCPWSIQEWHIFSSSSVRLDPYRPSWDTCATGVGLRSYSVLEMAGTLL